MKEGGREGGRRTVREGGKQCDMYRCIIQNQVHFH